MKIKYDAEKLYQMISDFYNISGISITILGKDRERVTNHIVKQQEFCMLMQKTHHCLCTDSDSQIITQCRKTKKPAFHTCHAGLFDASLPVIVDDEVVGYITLGQVRKNDDFSSIVKHLPKELVPHLEPLYKKLPLYNSAQMESVIRIVNAIITQIVKENMIEITTEELSILAAKYIDENLGEDLSVDNLCHHLNVSRNRLYQCFHQCFNLTVNEYITKKRIKKAIGLLKNPALSIDEVSKQAGFSEASYFYKVLKKETGKSPKFFRKDV